MPSSTVKVSGRDGGRPDFSGPVRVFHDDKYDMLKLRQCDELVTSVDPTVLSSPRESITKLDTTS